MSVLQYRYKDSVKEGDTKWESLTPGQYVTILPMDFDVFELKINGVVYTEWSDEIIKEYERAFIWERLGYDS